MNSVNNEPYVTRSHFRLPFRRARSERRRNQVAHQHPEIMRSLARSLAHSVQEITCHTRSRNNLACQRKLDHRTVAPLPPSPHGSELGPFPLPFHLIRSFAQSGRVCFARALESSLGKLQTTNKERLRSTRENEQKAITALLLKQNRTE